MQYTTINDAAEATNNKGYEPGRTRIWYARPEKTRDLGVGHDFCFKKGLLPSRANLEATHILVGAISATDPEAIFDLMQGERWSPSGQARSLITKLGLHHTSMSVGDVVQILDDTFFVDRDGFVLLDGR